MENPKTILIKNISTLITCDEKDTTYKNAFIYSENGIIKEIGEMPSINQKYLETPNIIDATNHVIYPGLINTHHH